MPIQQGPTGRFPINPLDTLESAGSAERYRHLVLLVEDNADVSEAMALPLEFEGYRVAAASNGLEAFNKLNVGLRPSVIVLVYRMPIMDVRGFRKRQLAHGFQVEVPVVLFSPTQT
jgi:CheY-like chemotaxis protein